MLLNLFVFLVSAQNSLDEIPVFFSKETPPSLLNEFSLFPNKEIISYSSAPLLPDSSISTWPVFIDLTLNQPSLAMFDQLSLGSGYFYITLGSNSNSEESSRRIYSLLSIDVESQAIEKLVLKLKLKDLIIFSSGSAKVLRFADQVHSRLKSKVFKLITYDENLDLQRGMNLVQKEVKNLGLRYFIIIDQGPSLAIIQNSLIAKRVNDVGALFIFSSFSMGEVFIEGSLILSQTGLESSSSYSNYCYLSVLKSIESKKNNSEIFSVLNLKNNQVVNVGIINEDVLIFGEILYPGGVNSINTSITKELVFLMANGSNEIHGWFNITIFSHIFNAAIYAVSKINSQNLIPGFKIVLRPTDTGIFWYEPEWYTKKLSEVLYKPFPILYLTSYWYKSALGNSITLKNLSMEMPQISSFSQNKKVESKENFPYLVKMTVSEYEYITNGLNFILSLGWKSVVLFGTDDQAYVDMYLVFLSLCKARGVNIVNPEHLRVIPDTYTRKDFPKFREYFEAAKATRCRFFMVFNWQSLFIFEGLYDVGVRKGELYTVSDIGIIESFIRETDPFQKNKFSELLSGSFLIGYKEWSGPNGPQVYQELSQIYESLSFFCMCHDTVTLATAAINYALAQGKDIENPAELMKIIRDIKVKGCMGDIYFSRDNNNIASAKFSISQFFVEDGENITQKLILTLDKLSDTFIVYENKIEWPENSIPSNFLEEYDCPFEEKEIRNSDKGLIVLLALCFILIIVSVICAFWSWKKFNSVYFEIEGIYEASFSDKVFFASFFFQFFQIVILGPNLAYFDQTLKDLNIFVSLNYKEYYSLSQDKFWKFYYFVLTFCISWTVFLCLIVLKYVLKVKNNWLLENLKILNEFLLPLISSITFMPVISMMMNLFLCRKSIGDNFSDLFLDSDCYTFCYSDSHKSFAILTFIFLVFYVSLSTFIRPYWENVQTCLMIRTKSWYLSILSVFQVILVCLSKTLKKSDQTAHGLVCALFIGLLVIVTAKFKPYNYAHANITQLTSLGLSFWIVFTSSIFREFKIFIVWAIITPLGFLIIIIAGLFFIYKTPNPLQTKKGSDIGLLFLFQFFKDNEVYARDLGYIYRMPNSSENEIRSHSDD